MPQARKRKNPIVRFLQGLKTFDMFGSNIQFNINGDTSYKTIAGFIWTIILACIMIAALVYYSIVYSDKKNNYKMTSQTVQTSNFPYMDFKKKGLFVSMLLSRGDKYYKTQDIQKYFQVNAATYTQESTSATGTDGNKERTPSPEGIKPTKITMAPCATAGIKPTVNGKAIQGKMSTALSDFGLCSIHDVVNSTMYMQGDDDSDTFSYIEIQLSPCNGTFGPTEDSTGFACALPNPYDDTISFTQAEEMRLRLGMRDLTVQLVLIQTDVDGSNYEDPLIYIARSNNKYALTSGQQKTITYYFKTVSVSTDKGVLFSNIVEQSSISVDRRLFDGKDRDVKERINVQTPTGRVTSSPHYMTFKFLSSNTKLEFTRTYIMLLDLIGLVGGLAQLVTSAILVIYSWYNSVMMDRDMTNSVVLNFGDDPDTLEPWEKERLLTFWDCLRFTYFKCAINKKSAKYVFYNRCADQAKENMNIIRMINAVTDCGQICDSILTHTQKVAIDRLNAEKAAQNDDEDESTESKDTDLPNVGEALKSVKHLAQTSNDPILKRVNQYLVDHFPYDLTLPIEDNFTNSSPNKVIAKRSSVTKDMYPAEYEANHRPQSKGSQGLVQGKSMFNKKKGVELQNLSQKADWNVPEQKL